MERWSTIYFDVPDDLVNALPIDRSPQSQEMSAGRIMKHTRAYGSLPMSAAIYIIVSESTVEGAVLWLLCSHDCTHPVGSW